MTEEQVLTALCWYDPRHPTFADCYGDEENPQPPRQQGCSCDNCFYGRDALAMEVLRLRAALQRQTLATRAASLLERLAPQPVPVSERLPGPGDCDSLGRCWWWYPETAGTLGYWQWEADAMEREADSQPVAWLPAHALPLPGEGERSA